MVLPLRLRRVNLQRLNETAEAVVCRTWVRVALFTAAFLWFWLFTLSGVASA